MKQKTIKTASKRVLKVTKTGKIMRRQLSAQHLVAGKSKRTLTKTSKTTQVAKADRKKLKRMIPNR